MEKTVTTKSTKSSKVVFYLSKCDGGVSGEVFGELAGEHPAVGAVHLFGDVLHVDLLKVRSVKRCLLLVHVLVLKLYKYVIKIFDVIKY